MSLFVNWNLLVCTVEQEVAVVVGFCLRHVTFSSIGERVAPSVGKPQDHTSLKILLWNFLS